MGNAPLRNQSGIQAAQAEAARARAAEGQPEPDDATGQVTQSVGASAPTSTAPPTGRPGDARS
jgi:hypothetical protein